MRAFISYSSADKVFTRRLASDLKARGIDVWLDEWEIKVGDEIRQKIEHGIAEYDFFVIVLSKRSIASTWVEKELNAAFMKEVNTRKIVILPVKLEECNIPPLISGKKYADFSKSFGAGLKELLRVLQPEKSYIPRETSTNVIFVETDISLAQIFASALKKFGLSSSITNSQETALELTSRYQPNAIFFGIRYASENDFAYIVSDIREVCPNVRIIGLSKNNLIPTRIEALFDKVLYIPCTLDALTDSLGIKEKDSEE